MNFNYRRATFLLLLCSMGSAYARSVAVAYDSGDTTPMVKFYRPFSGERQTSTPVKPITVDENAYFPVHSANLKPSIISTHAHQKAHLQNLPQPIFLVGSDDLSRTWLRDNREKLLALHAVGYVVEVSNVRDFKEVKAIAEPLPILPASADDFAAPLGLDAYPVLITQHEISQ